jgi:hypothetical protein
MSNKVTYIEDLFDLDDVRPDSGQQSMQGYPPKMNQNYGRQMDDELSERDSVSKPLQGKIRKHYDHRMAANGGVPVYSQPPNAHNAHNSHNVHNVHNAYPQDYLLIERNHPQHPQHPQHPRGNHGSDYDSGDESEFEMGPKARRPVNMSNIPNIPNIPNPSHPQEFRCIDIARHIKHCPICSKFYDNDRSIYIIIIIILVIICIILLKKLLENIKPQQ